MLQARQHPDLANESELGGLGIGVGVQNFQRNLALVSRIVGQIDGGECTLPDLASYLVATGERGSERGNGIARSK
jgi:hypothetical protein